MNRRVAAFSMAFVLCAVIDFASKNVFQFYAQINQEKVYCIWQSAAFASYITLLYFFIRELEYKPITFLALNWIGFALSDLYDECFGNPYVFSFWEYIPLYATILATIWMMLKTSLKDNIKARLKKLVSH